MAVQLNPFPDAERVAMAILGGLATVVTATADPIVAPVIRVNRVGGPDDQITDYPRIEVAVYGVDRPSAWSLAEQCRQTILAARRTSWPQDGKTATVDFVDTITPAAQVPYENPDVRRVVAIYQLQMRRLR